MIRVLVHLVLGCVGGVLLFAVCGAVLGVLGYA